MAQPREQKKKEDMTTAQNNPFPPFYKKPVPLTPEKHAKYSLKEQVRFPQATTTSSMVLNAIEFAAAVRNYPIVFAGQEDNLIPIAIMGLKDGTNLFVDKKGNFMTGAYIPAYARRYPFIFMEGQTKEQLILCIDEDSDLVVKSDVRPFFNEDGQKSPLTERALQFCAQFQQEFERTKLFVKALREKDLLVPHRADIQLRNGEQFSVGGFYVIDENKFNQLSNETYLEWRQMGYIALIYCHLISTVNWQNLINYVAEPGNFGGGDGLDHWADAPKTKQ